MSLKAKLVSTIAAFCMVICLLSVGIWAAQTGTINVGGSVSFEASDVEVTVTGKIEGAEVNTWAEGATGVTWTAATTAEQAAATWDEINLKFVKNTETGKLNDITITLTITNNNTQRPVYVKLEADPEVTNGEGITVKYNTVAQVDAKPAQGTSSKDVTIVISAVGDAAQSLTNVLWGAKLTLSNATIA